MIKTISKILVGVFLLSTPNFSICQKLPVLNIEDAYKKQEPINSNEFIASIKYHYYPINNLDSPFAVVFI